MISADRVVEMALQARTVDALIVIVTDRGDASLRWAGNSMTTNGVTQSRGWTVIALIDDDEGVRVGTVASSTVDADSIPDVVRAAEEAARSAPPARDVAPLVEDTAIPDDWADPAPLTDVQVFAPIVGDLAAGFDGADRLYGFAHHRVETTLVGSSTGLRRRRTVPTATIEINGKRGDPATGPSAWVGAHGADFGTVAVPELLAELGTRLGWANRRVDLPAERYETLLPPSAVADLMIPLLWSMEGRGAQEGRTALSRAGGTRVGEKLTDLPLTLYSDPQEAGLECLPFVAAAGSTDSVSIFDNGMPLRRTDWIREGTIGSLVYPRAAAEEFGVEPTGAIDNLVLSAGSGGANLAEMVAGTERGLLLTTLWYIREVDPATLLLTGLTRDGVYLVEDGEVTAAVNNFRFNESPLDLLRRVTEVGRTEHTLPREQGDWFTRAAMPALRIPDFHMSSVSQAQ